MEGGRFVQFYKEEFMDPCSCKSGAKAVFYCIEEWCPNHKKKPTYCNNCNEAKVHNHATVTIAVGLERWENEFKITEV